MYINKLIISSFLALIVGIAPLSAKETSATKKQTPQVDALSANKKLVTTALEALYKGDLPTCSPLFSVDFVDNDPAIASERSYNSMVLFSNTIRTAVTDAKFQIDEIQAVDDKVFVMGRLFGSHNGIYQGLVPSGLPVSLKTADLFKIEGNLITARWGVRDLTPLLQSSISSMGLIIPLDQTVSTGSTLPPPEGSDTTKAQVNTIPADGRMKTLKPKGSSTTSSTTMPKPVPETDKKTGSK